MARFGLDFGTTTTYLSNLDQAGEKLVPLGTKAGEVVAADSVAMFSTVRISNGKYEIGKPHEDEVPLKISLQSNPKSAEVRDAILAIFMKVIEIAKQNNLDLTQDDTVRLGCPANWDQEARRALVEIAKKANIGLLNDTLMDEAVAAGVAWIQNNEALANEPGTTLVFDMGGGTLDVAVLDARHDPQRNANEIFVLSSVANGFAGDTLDRSLAAIIKTKVQRKNAEGAIIRAAEEAKKLLSRNPSAEFVDVELFALGEKVRLTRSELLSELAPLIKEAKSTLGLALHRAFLWDLLRKSGIGPNNQVPHVEDRLHYPNWTGWLVDESKLNEDDSYRKDLTDQLAKSVRHVVLAGGMSNIPEIQDELRKYFKNATFSIGANPPGAKAGEHDASRVVGLGLGNQDRLNDLNFDRPPFAIVANKVEIHPAFESTLVEQFIGDSAPVMRKTKRLEAAQGFVPGNVCEFKIAKFGNPLSQPIPIKLADGRPLSFTLGKDDPRSILYPDGTLVVFDGNGGRHVANVEPYRRAGFIFRESRILETASSITAMGNPEPREIGVKPELTPRFAKEYVELFLNQRKSLLEAWGEVRFLKEFVSQISKINNQFAGANADPNQRKELWFGFLLATKKFLGWKDISIEHRDELVSLTQ